ncbi:olfactory receptor 2AT4-like [Engraulis encrasicolus]|uniref:olfactory receptor 2AT4-like n=1 Tax=Engraulis encrasicolus TaxID=184585 RepID=UPI002FCE97A4
MSQEKNWTAITEFFLEGFPTLHPDYNGLIAFIFCVVYVITVVGNTILIVTYVHEPKLHKSMYIIMLSLAVSDIGFSTVTLPKAIARYWFNDVSTPFNVCMSQMFLVHYFGTVNSYIMGIMAMDRYIAICFPFRYPVVMSYRIMSNLNVAAWAVGFITPFIMTILNTRVPYCGPNRITQCYCDHINVITKACGDTGTATLVAFTQAMLVLLIPLGFIVYSYVHIIVSVMRIASAQGRWKAFSTCITQILIISLYFLPRCTVYVFDLTGVYLDVDIRITLVLFYSLFPPLANPFIYCLRTREIKQTLARWFSVNSLMRKSTVVATM